MRAGAVILIASLALVGGCQKYRKAPSATVQRHQAELRYADSGREAALAMTPPAAADNPRLNLARDPRERSVFMGFESSTTTFFYVRMDDRQTEDGRNDRLERRAISEKVGTSYR